jgi:hypothetical protein
MRCSCWFVGLGFQPTTNSATREAKGLSLVAAAKKELAEHAFRVHPRLTGR